MEDLIVPFLIWYAILAYQIIVIWLAITNRWRGDPIVGLIGPIYYALKRKNFEVPGGDLMWYALVYVAKASLPLIIIFS